MSLNEEDMHLSDPDVSPKLDGTQESDESMPQPERPDFDRMTQDAKAYGERVLARFAGEAREEVAAAVDLIHTSLDTVAIYSRRVPSLFMDRADNALRDLNEIIPWLNDYGIEDTQPLEEIRDELLTWLQSLGRGPSPTPPHF